MTWMRNGVRYKKVASRGSRFGGPLVHIATYQASTLGWEPICMKVGIIGSGYKEVRDGELVTCKKCIFATDDQGKEVNKW